jgi:cell division protein FtsL
MTMATVAVRAARGWGRPARLALGVLALVATLFLFVFPTRSYLAQREAVDDARERVEVLREQNDRLEAELRRLQTPSEIERLAREQYNMVLPGERAFTVVPAPPVAGPSTTAAP